MTWQLRLVILLLLIIFIVLQYRLWVGEGSLAEVNLLTKQIHQQQAELAGLKARNLALRAEIDDLKKGRDAIEARARKELGMIKKGEVFYQIVPKKPAAAP